MKNLLILIIILLPAAPAQGIFSEERLYRHIAVLGDDSLQGRGTGTVGCETAARYIEDQLKAYGLTPPPGQSSFLQTVPIHGSTPLAETQLSFYDRDTVVHAELQKDYLLYTTGDQTFIPAPVPLIFVGYGIVAPEFDYNDYQQIDVTNAIVVFLSGEPFSADSAYFDGDRPTIYSSLALKQKTALARGARGSIMIPNPREHEMNNWYEQQRQFFFEEARLLYAPSSNLNILIHPRIAQLLFHHAPYSLSDVERMDKKGSMKSFTLALRASFQGKFFERDFLSSNVVGMIEGSDPALRDSYVLVSAHYDHLGIGPPVNGDSIYNGVFDNAAGVSATLELVRAIAHLKEKPKRSIIVAFLTGEERGFLGSQYYCFNPAVPLYKTVADINIDGLALFDSLNSVVGLGKEFSTLGDFLAVAAKECGLRVDDPPAIFLDLQPFSNSDQFMFAQAGIPSMLIMEGLRYKHTSYEEGLRRMITWGKEIYHSPFDDLHQPMDLHAGVQHTMLLYTMIMNLANSAETPEWYPGSIFRSARLQSRAEKR
ncbi:MAG: M28 family peptidase [Bacteroidota bacterium]|jgi:hypothetical protein